LTEHENGVRSLRLSKRLTAVANFVTPGLRLADIGTDHAYLPIALVQAGIIPGAIAMDINDGPLRAAKEHISSQGLSEVIQTRLSDGLTELTAGEADSVVIAGMGGALTVRILNGAVEWLSPTAEAGENLMARELILQPQSEIFLVRRWLQEHGWRIEAENMVFEDGKYYPMMKAVPGKMQLGRIEEVYGPKLLRDKNPVLQEYLVWERGVFSKIEEGLTHADPGKAGARPKEISEKIALCDEAMRTCQFKI